MSARVALSRISELKFFDNDPLGFETQSSSKYCRKAFALIQISRSTTCIEHPPIGLSKDLLEHFIMPIFVVEFFSKFYIHMLRYHLNTDVKQCANNADTKGCPDYCSLREA